MCLCCGSYVAVGMYLYEKRCEIGWDCALSVARWVTFLFMDCSISGMCGYMKGGAVDGCGIAVR